jgi:transposase
VVADFFFLGKIKILKSILERKPIFRMIYIALTAIGKHLSQGIRRGTVRRSRYKGLQKTHLQETATAAGINILRTINHLNQVPVAKTRVSRFARLAH